MNIIDVHSHLPTDSGNIPGILDSARRNQVRCILVSSLAGSGGSWSEFPSDAEIAAANEHTFRHCEKHPDILRGYVYLNPNENWSPELARWSDHPAFVGIKLWIALKDETGSPDICRPVLRAAAELRAPVLIHSFYRHGGNMRGELNPTEVVHLARSVPETYIIMAHLGGAWEKGCRAVSRPNNIFVDISGGAASRGCVELAVKLCGKHRVLFGADAPCRTIQSQLAKVKMSKVADSVKNDILTNNAQHLFKTLHKL